MCIRDRISSTLSSHGLILESFAPAIESAVTQTSRVWHWESADTRRFRCPAWKRSKVPPIRPTWYIFPTPVDCVPRGVTAAFTAKLWRLTHPGTFVGLWGSPMIHSIRSSGDLTQSGHLLCSSDHSVADSHTGLRQVATHAWYLGSYYSSGVGLRHHGVAARARLRPWEVVKNLTVEKMLGI